MGVYHEPPIFEALARLNFHTGFHLGIVLSLCRLSFSVASCSGWEDYSFKSKLQCACVNNNIVQSLISTEMVVVNVHLTSASKCAQCVAIEKVVKTAKLREKKVLKLAYELFFYLSVRNYTTKHIYFFIYT